nr:DUF1439 domain-containing protein [uncultured Albidiferax sp.]
MQRRLFLNAVLVGTSLSALAAQPQPGYTVSAAQLQQAVAQRFPLRYPVPGVLNLDLQAPRLSLLPAQNRLAAQMAVEAAGPALRRSHSGSVTVDFALRYEPSDRTVRAVGLHFQNLQFPSLQPAVVDLLTTYGPALAEQALQDVVLHQLKPQDLALPDTMGLQPGSITVTDQGLVVGFVNKPM